MDAMKVKPLLTPASSYRCETAEAVLPEESGVTYFFRHTLALKRKEC